MVVFNFYEFLFEFDPLIHMELLKLQLGFM